MRILISGASIAGPVLAYWLTRYGFTVTVVEKAPTLRKTGGHAVDLFRPSMRISEEMGVLPRIMAHATGTERLVLHAPRRSISLDMSRIFQAATDRHVEIMRDDLSEIYYDATRNDVEYVFGDSIAAISPEGRVRFDSGAARDFDLVVGADGLRSNVRNLVFGAVPEHFLGGYLAVASGPREAAVPGEFTSHMEVGRVAGIYTAECLTDSRILFLFRPERPLDYDHRDPAQQKRFVREAFGGLAPQVDSWLAELDDTAAFYFDSITQLRLEQWSRDRVTLVGDAAYCPGPAVGGSTSLAIVGAHTLAGELAVAGGDHRIAFPAYERAMAESVRGSRKFAMRAAKTLVPTSAFGLHALVQAARIVNALPTGLSRAATKLGGNLRLHDSLPVREYPQGRTQLHGTDHQS
ncbi:FAD-dependent monooxygenase [Nocardia huaxiensis]|uniref:FAD-dependent monooxygenase n=1 Tax=Nocardia huaxiensis TaxID=2755382 RepID=A0A7D6VE21_9NOCA|nr:FAD-dependent monooxygenase [Nocardia huaxiensis]QLY28016.1 FAD-dependent monooxygenase [Nocardia huaxiensis]UFS98576.1 FAD-dependent monooxygenase [Nocardia huaxiensis]